MNRDALGPLLRGIGTTVILIATMITFFMAQRGKERQRAPGADSTNAENRRQTTIGDAPGIEHPPESITEEVIENRWFELFGFTGSAIVAGSFYAEWYARKSKSD